MGSVYLADDTQLKRRVALKIPKFAANERPEVIQRFYREAQAAATLQHRNICTVHDVGQSEGLHYLTMAYIEGRTLAELIRPDKPLPERQVAILVRKLALALDEAHRQGILHRDLKPSNILIDRQREPVIMDFGLAKRVGADEDHLTKTGAILGTAAFMSPEQVETPESIGPAADVYSLGVILYQLLTGRLPFDGPPASVIGQLLIKEPEPVESLRPEVSPQLAEICRKAMAKRIDERYASMAEFASVLTDYLRQSLPEDRGLPSMTGGVHKDNALTTLFSAVAAEGTAKRFKSAMRLPQQSSWLPERRRATMAVGLGSTVVVVLLGTLVQFAASGGTLVVEIDEPDATIEVLDESGTVVIRQLAKESPLNLAVDPGKHRLRVVKDSLGVFERDFVIAARGKEVIKVRLQPVPGNKLADSKTEVEDISIAPESPSDHAAIPEVSSAVDLSAYTAGWSKPVNLGPRINSSVMDASPALSSDGLVLVFASNRDGGLGNSDLWLCTRRSPDRAFDAPVNMGKEINTSSRESDPSLSDNALTLVFSSARSGGAGNNDLWMSTRKSVDAVFSQPVNLGKTINTTAFEGAPAISSDRLTLVFASDRPSGLGGSDLWISERTSVAAPFGPAINLGPALNCSRFDGWPTLSVDGRTLIFSSRRSGGFGMDDLWISARSSIYSKFALPVNLGATINSSEHDGGPSLSCDSTLLLFHSQRPGGHGDYDLWMSTRKSPVQPLASASGDTVQVWDAGDRTTNWTRISDKPSEAAQKVKPETKPPAENEQLEITTKAPSNPIVSAKAITNPTLERVKKIGFRTVKSIERAPHGKFNTMVSREAYEAAKRADLTLVQGASTITDSDTAIMDLAIEAVPSGTMAEVVLSAEVNVMGFDDSPAKVWEHRKSLGIFAVDLLRRGLPTSVIGALRNDTGAFFDKFVDDYRAASGKQ